MGGRAIEVDCVVRVLARDYHGVTLPAYRATVVGLESDEQGPYVVVRQTGRGREQHLARPVGVEVIRGVVRE